MESPSRARKTQRQPAGLVVRSVHPLNAETALPLLGERVTPLPSVFVRCHFHIPRVDPTSLRLVVEGEVARPLALGLDELRAGRVVERRVTFECAGNGRSAMRPAPPGIAWELGAASTVKLRRRSRDATTWQVGPSLPCSCCRPLRRADCSAVKDRCAFWSGA